MTTKTATAAIALTKRFCFTFRLFLSLRVLHHSLVFPLHINLDFHARAGIPRSHLHKQHIPILLNKTHSMSFVSVINFFLLLVLPGGVSHTPFYCLPPAATPESHKEEATTQKKIQEDTHASTSRRRTGENTRSSKGRHSRNSLQCFRLPRALISSALRRAIKTILKLQAKTSASSSQCVCNKSKVLLAGWRLDRTVAACAATATATTTTSADADDD